MDVQAVRNGLAAAAAVIPELNCYGYVPDEVSEPAFVAGEVTIDFDQTFNRGTDQIIVTCLILVSRSDAELGQKLLADYLSGSGAKSLKVALETARGEDGEAALGGACDDFHVRGAQGYRYYTLGGVNYFGAALSVLVIGDGA